MVKHLCVLILLTLLAPCLYAADVTATLEESEINTGEAVFLTININGGKTNLPAFPEIADLIIHDAGQNSMTNIINGRISSSQQYRFVVGSHFPGTYTIPSLSMKVDGKTLTTTALTLSVIGKATHSPAKPEAEGSENFGKLTVEFAKSERTDLYLTEISPVIIRATIPISMPVDLRSGIQLDGNGFTLHNISAQPLQNQEMVDGKPSIILTWFGGISATRAGTHPLSSSIKILAAIPNSGQPPLRLRNSRREQLVGGKYDQREVVLRSTEMKVDVLPLPTEGKPADFSGAVGEFVFDGIEIPKTWKTGEPQNVALRIKGSGNFAMMQAPPLTPLELWKTYPGKDQFTPRDRASFSGSKIFQYNAIPRKAGSLPVSFTLHYFDPIKRAYQSIQSPANSITITGADYIDPADGKTNVEASTPKQEDDKSALAPLREGKNYPNLLSKLTNKTNTTIWSIITASICISIIFLSFLIRRISNPILKAQQKRKREITAALAHAEQAIRQNDINAYWQAARSSIQLPLAEKWQVQAHAITLHDVATRCGTDSQITTFFREADTATYSKQHTQPPWDTWRTLHQKALLALTTLSA